MQRSGEAVCGCVVQTGSDPLGLTLAAMLNEQPFSLSRCGKGQAEHWYQSSGCSPSCVALRTSKMLLLVCALQLSPGNSAV